jgi:glycosyltransferase involved in cell wall biosynthesis
MQGMVEQYVDLSAKRTEAIHYGFDPDLFHAGSENYLPVLEKIELWKQEGYKVILNVSAYAIHKNIETLVDALSLLSENGHKVKLITTASRDRTGDKAEYDALQKRIRRKDLNDVFMETGHVAYGKLNTLYQAADVFAFPSFTESFGHPMVEAMASGLPLVVADTSVNREVCGDAALYFETFSPESCAEQIKRCLNSPELAEQLEIEAKNRASDFSWRKHVQDLVKLFRKLKDKT